MLPDKIIQFFHKQSFIIVSTIDEKGRPHSSCKGIVEIGRDGTVYLFDLYKMKTFENLRRNPQMSITAVDEHKFMGYCLKGKVKMIKKEDITPRLINAWDDRIASRITQRVLKNALGERGHPSHPEARLPKPEYLLAMEVEEVVDLTPHPMRQKYGNV